MQVGSTYTITVLLDVNEVQDVDDRAESRSRAGKSGLSGWSVSLVYLVPRSKKTRPTVARDRRL
jgi:hypothetical protein